MRERWVQVTDLVDVPMIAQRLGVETSTVRSWRERYEDFPEPVIVLSAGRGVWSWVEVRAWVDRRGNR